MSEAKADKIKESIAALEAQRSTLGDAVVDSAIAALREQLSQLRPDADKGATLDERKLVTILFADIAGFTAATLLRGIDFVHQRLLRSPGADCPKVRGHD